MISIKILRDLLYDKYSQKELSKKIGLSPVQISRLLNEKSKMTVEQYNKFSEMIK